MSPLTCLFRITRCYLLAGLLFGFVAALVSPWGLWFAAGAAVWQSLGATVLLLLATACLCIAAIAAAQTGPLLRYWKSPADLLAALKRDLDSPKTWKRRRALQVFVAHNGYPFGRMQCWPISMHSAAQLRNMILLCKECLQIRKDFIRDGLLSPQILQRMVSPAKIVLWRKLSDWKGMHPPSLARPFPSVPPDRLVAELRVRVDEALLHLADILNQSSGRRAVEAQVRDIIGDLVWDALTSALRLGIDAELAAPENRTHPVGALRRAATEALDRASEAVKDAIRDLGVCDDEPAPDPERRPLPPVEAGRLAAALREPVERTLAAFADRVNATRNLEGMVASEKEVCDLFDALAHHALELAAGLRVDAAADRLPWPAAQGEWARKFRRMAAMESIVEPEQNPMA